MPALSFHSSISASASVISLGNDEASTAPSPNTVIGPEAVSSDNSFGSLEPRRGSDDHFASSSENASLVEAEQNRTKRNSSSDAESDSVPPRKSILKSVVGIYIDANLLGTCHSISRSCTLAKTSYNVLILPSWRVCTTALTRKEYSRFSTRIQHKIKFSLILRRRSRSSIG